MITLKGWQQQILRKTNTYYFVRRAYRDTQLLFWQTRSILKSKGKDATTPESRQGHVTMFHAMRSGSGVLTDLLKQHPKIFWDGEINPAYIQKWHKKKVVNGTRNLSEAVRRVQRRMIFAPQKRFYGFEVTLNDFLLGHISLSDYVEHIHNLGINYFIILIRKNFLRKIVSMVIAMKRGQTHILSREKVRLTRISLDTQNLTEKLQNHHDYFSMLDNLIKDKKVLRLTYEDDISKNPVLGYRRVCNFLGIECFEFPIRYKKTNPYNLSEIIYNFKEVEHTLRGTPFEWMLYD